MRLTWLLLLTACNRPGADSAPSPQTGASPVALEAVAVVSKQLDTTVKLPAELSPDESVALSPRVQGFIDEISVDRGSLVKKGQVLARLAAPELAAQRAEAASQVTAARSTFERLKAASTTPGAIAGHDARRSLHHSFVIPMRRISTILELPTRMECFGLRWSWWKGSRFVSG